MENRCNILSINSYNFCFHDYGARMYDPAIGRFTGLDPIASNFAHVTPYNYAENEPVGSIDLWGLQRWIVNGRERTSAPSGFTQKGRAIGTSIAYPRVASSVGQAEFGGTNISSVCGRIARHAAENGNMSVGIGTERNAFRHALWSSTITSEFGIQAARDITNAHEGVGIGETSRIDFTQAFEGNDADLADNVVDILNNAIGMEIGQNNEGATPLELATQVLDVFASEGLWVATTDENGNITIQRQTITQDQYNTASNNLINLDQNGMSEEDRRQSEENEQQ